MAQGSITFAYAVKGDYISSIEPLWLKMPLRELELTINALRFTTTQPLQLKSDMEESNTITTILKALRFASIKHRDQRRKDAEVSPYINHPIEVAELLARVGGATDLVILQGAILHDTIEDTETTPEELEAEFGPEVRRVVEDVTDDKRLPKAERKRLQIEHAPHLSERAKQIKIADMISNVKSVTETPPTDWPLERRRDYLGWTERVVAGLRGCNQSLENDYDLVLEYGRRVLDDGRE